MNDKIYTNYKTIEQISKENLVAKRTIEKNINFVRNYYSNSTDYCINELIYNDGQKLYIAPELVPQLTKRKLTRLIHKENEIDTLVDQIKQNQKLYSNITLFGTISPKDFTYEDIIHLQSLVFEYFVSKTDKSIYLLFSLETNNNVYTEMLHSHFVTNVEIKDEKELIQTRKDINKIIAETTPKGLYCYRTLELRKYDPKRGGFFYSIKTRKTSEHRFTGCYLH